MECGSRHHIMWVAKHYGIHKMANENIVAGLFGMNPEQIRAQQFAGFDQDARQIAQMNPFERANYGIYKGAGMLAGMGMEKLGYQTPAMAEAQRTQSAFQGADLNSPEGLRAAAQRMLQFGDQQRAYILSQLADKKDAELQAGQVRATEMARNLAQAEKAMRPEQEGGAQPTVSRLLAERSKYNPGSQEYKILSNAIAKETYIKPERESESGMKPADELRYMNQHSKDYGSAVSTIDTSSDALRVSNRILSNPKFGYLFGGYTEKALGKLAPGEIAGIQSDISSLKSNLMSAGLGIVKQANQAGIGAITEKEWPIFENMIANLDQKMDEKTARAKLAEINAFFERTQKRAAESYKKKWSKKEDFYDPSIEDMLKPTQSTAGESQPVVTPVVGGVKSWNPKTGKWETK